MPNAANTTYYCEKCKKTMRADQFYGSNNKEKYPEGKLHQCKKCITMHVDNWDSETYLWILQEIDVPYVPKEWDKLLGRYAQDPSKLTGLSILGRYLSVMKLQQYKDYRWQDTKFIQELENKKIEETMKRQGYGAAEIAEVINKGLFEVPKGDLKQPEVQEEASFNAPTADYSFGQAIENDLVSDLTEEDKRYLCLMWGKQYRPDEWVRLEQLYQDMMSSYDIQTAGDKNTLILACKASLKANQLMDMGD